MTKVQITAVEQHLAACLMLNHLVSCRVLHIFSKRSSYITLFTQVPSAENPRANYTNKKFRKYVNMIFTFVNLSIRKGIPL